MKDERRLRIYKIFCKMCVVCCSDSSASLVALAEPAVTVIAKARAVCKTFRNQKFMAAIKQAGQKNPMIDCLTRWCSTSLKLERLIKLKEFIAELKKR
jgi:hypothetical protein